MAARSLRVAEFISGRYADHAGNSLPRPLVEYICEFLRVDCLPKIQIVSRTYGECLSAYLARRPVIARQMRDHLDAKDVVRKRVWVAVRTKPVAEGDEGCIDVRHRRVRVRGGPDESFFFDAAFDKSASQRDVWSRVSKPIMSSILDGENVCFLAYGQTGSGKTHTMFGDRNVSEAAGISFRALRSLSRLLQSSDVHGRGLNPSVEFSFLEVYNEKVYDLLNEQRQLELSLESEVKRQGSKYQATEYSKAKHVAVKGLTRRRCDIQQLEEQVGDWMDEGASTRTVGKTVFNARSSRSHAVATLHITWAEGGKETRLYLVDLAGSERAGQHALSHEQLKEGVNINKSLSTMARVITVLASGAAEHVPYRDSTLTWLLSDSITGINARTFMIAALNPLHEAETLSTLRYAQQYSSLQSNQEEINKIGSHVRKSLAIVQSLRQQLKAELEGSGEKDAEGKKITRTTLKAKLDAAVGNRTRASPQMQQLAKTLRLLEDAERAHANRQDQLQQAKDKNRKQEEKMINDD